MARLCLSSTTLKISKVKNGSFSFIGWPRTVQFAREIIEIFKPSDVVIETFNAYCVKRLKNNLSDISATRNAIKSDSFYYIPVINGEEAPYIMSGYEVNEYVNSQVSRPQWKQGLIKNFRAFDVSTYLAIFSLCFVFILVRFLADYYFFAQIKNWPCILNRMEQRDKLKNKSHLRFLIFVFYLLFFFVTTPFLNIFSTSQVVTEKPKFIYDYESLMRSNITILSAMTNNVQEYFRPTAKSIERNDLTARFYNYYKRKKIDNKIYRANFLKEHNQNHLAYYYHVTENLVHERLALITHSFTAELYKGRLCALSRGNDLFRVFASIDPTQRKILVGFPFRTGYTNNKLAKKLTVTSEFQSIQGGHSSRIKEITCNLENNLDMSAQHRQKQKDLCLDERIEAERKQDTFASDVDFFKLFWTFLASILFVDIYVLVYENIKFLRV